MYLLEKQQLFVHDPASTAVPKTFRAESWNLAANNILPSKQLYLHSFYREGKSHKQPRKHPNEPAFWINAGKFKKKKEFYLHTVQSR